VGNGVYGYVKGRFHGRMADGTAIYQSPPPSTCNSGTVFWEAHKRGHN